MIDFARVSLDTLLKMAHDAQLIEHYERRDRYALIVVDQARHLVTNETARSFLRDVLTDWWNRELEKEKFGAKRDIEQDQSPDPLA